MKKNKYLASVVIPTYNRKKILSYTLQSLVQQHMDADTFEVIIVDDGSHDHTEEVVSSYKGRLNIKYIFQEDEGRRVSLARNKGIQSSASSICILIDSGVILGPDSIAEHIQSHQSNSNPVAVIGYVHGMEDSSLSMEMLEEIIDINHIEESIRYLEKTRLYIDPREQCYMKYPYGIELLPAPWIFFWTANVSINKDCFDKDEDIFDEAFDLNWGSEDLELGYRLHKKGVKIMVNKQATSIHLPHKRFENLDSAKLVNAQKFHEKHRLVETQLLLELIEKGVHDMHLNDYLILNNT